MNPRALRAHGGALASELDRLAADIGDPFGFDANDRPQIVDPASIAGGHGRSGQPLDDLSFGARDSGRGILVWRGQTSVLRASLPQGMRTGLSSVHVHVSDAGPVPVGDVLGHRIILTVRWQTGNAGGECEIDATRGCHFTVGGVHSIEIDARSTNIMGGDVVTTAGTTKAIEAVVHWNGAVSPKPCWIVSERLTLAAGVESAMIPIPAQAESLLLLSTVPASLPAVTARFRYAAVLGGPLAYVTLDPNANGTPITGGVEVVSFLSPVLMVVQPTWESYL